MSENNVQEKEQKKQKGPATFNCTENGVWYRDKHGNDDDSAEEGWAYVCGPLHIKAETRDSAGSNWGHLLEWVDGDHRTHRQAVPWELLVANGTELIEILSREGLRIEPGKNRLLRQYIAQAQPIERVLCVTVTGWHDIPSNAGAERVFVLPDKTITSNARAEPVVLQGRLADAAYRGETGSLTEWQTNVAAKCAGNSRLVFGAAVAFAATLLNIRNMASCGFHFYGLSSTGKSTLLEVAASVWGYSIETWRTTDNALEGVAEAHNDVLLCLDELSQFDPNKAAQTAYMLGNGEGKARMNQSIQLETRKKWRTLFLSTGEITLTDHCQSTGVNPRAGADIRMLNIEADAGAGFGVFEKLHGANSAAEFADSIRNASRQHRGTAGPAFVEHIIKQWNETASRVKDCRDQFIDKYMPKHSSGEIPRAFERFALIAAAGELATKAGITGWNPGEAMQAVATVAESWATSRTTGSSDMDRAVTQIRSVLQTQANRFEVLDSNPDTNRRPTDRMGFTKTDDNGRTEYLVFPETFKSDLCKNHDPKVVARELHKRGYLRITGKGRLQVQQRVKGMGSNGQVWVYAINETIFNAEEAEPIVAEPEPVAT